MSCHDSTGCCVSYYSGQSAIHGNNTNQSLSVNVCIHHTLILTAIPLFLACLLHVEWEWLGRMVKLGLTYWLQIC